MAAMGWGICLMKFTAVENFSIFLHNCDAIRDAQCIRIYKDFLIILARIRWKLDPNSFRHAGEMGKRAVLNKVMNNLLEEGIISINRENGEIQTANGIA